MSAAKQIIDDVPVKSIRVVNPRTRNREQWLAVVKSIEAVGLKKPITVSRRLSPDTDGNLFDLVCGQGRLEAMRELGQLTVPAIIIDADEPERHLMSLVENIARRPNSHTSIYFEVRSLRGRGYEAVEIAGKLGLDRSYIQGIVRLVERGESRLIEAVESGTLPVSVAVRIANGDDVGLQDALLQGYESGELRGDKLRAVRRIIRERNSQEPRKRGQPTKAMTASELTSLFKQRVQEQQRLVRKADQAKDRLLVLVTVMRELFSDENFVTLLRAEAIVDLPEPLSIRLR